MGTILKLNELTKKYGNKVVVDNLNIEIQEGEVLGVLGRSGSGKSVLLNMLRGIPEYEPDEGEIIYHVSMCSDCNYIDAPSKASFVR